MPVPSGVGLRHPEVEPDQQRHRGRVADERAERADVEQRQLPRPALLHDLHLLPRRRRHGGQVVHPEPRGGRREQRQAGIGVRRPLEVDAGARRLHEAEDAGAADHDREQQLDQRDPEVAAGRVEPERRALLVGGVEEVDVGHRRGEVAAADARGRGDQAEDPVGRRRVLHGVREQQRRHQQQRAADDRPVAPAELRHRERVGQPQQRADEVGERHEQEQLLRGEREALREQEGRGDAPDQPDREADVLGEDRPHQVAAGDRAAGRLPEVGVLRAPVLDPATRAAGRGGAHADERRLPVCHPACRSGGGVVNFSSRPHTARSTRREALVVRPFPQEVEGCTIRGEQGRTWDRGLGSVWGRGSAR